MKCGRMNQNKRKRFTFMNGGHWRVKLGEREIRARFVDLLAAYENLGFTPSEIKQQLDEYRAYRHVCGCHSPEDVKLAISTREGYDKYRENAADIIEEAIDTLIEVGNGVTDEMLHKLCSKLFVLRDIFENEIGQEGDQFVRQCAEDERKKIPKSLGHLLTEAFYALKEHRYD